VNPVFSMSSKRQEYFVQAGSAWLPVNGALVAMPCRPRTVWRVPRVWYPYMQGTR
jgi:hypothetical protein